LLEARYLAGWFTVRRSIAGLRLPFLKELGGCGVRLGNPAAFLGGVSGGGDVDEKALRLRLASILPWRG